MYDVIIIGSGIAGLNAGLYAARASLKVLIIGSELGGNLNKTHKNQNEFWIDIIIETGFVDNIGGGFWSTASIRSSVSA